MGCVCVWGGALHCFMEGVNCCSCPPRGQSVYPFIHPCSYFGIIQYLFS